MDLQGKIALVTGAAHRVGKALALALAQQGMHVIVHYGGSVDAAQQTAEEIRNLGVDALPFQADLHDASQIELMFRAVADRFGRLDVLVNSASSFAKQPFDEVTPADFDDAMTVNVEAPFICSQQAARLMNAVQRDQPALIVNIADLAGVHPWHNFIQHGVSKAALIHLTRISAYELAPTIRVNAITPGAILPPAGMDISGDRWQNMGDRVPLKRVGNPGYIAETLIFLARNDYITGALIPVDGGEHLLGAVTH
jgi:NAD(P)-dependent dehydrogenase (short-subunit alcohol dehydrogenase family)